MLLTAEEKRVRKMLVSVAKGDKLLRRCGRVSYKEVWEHIRPNDAFGMGHVPTIVGWIGYHKNSRMPWTDAVTSISSI